MVTVTLRETYDLSTKPNKMTLIGIHTPSKNIIKKLYPGFVEQFKMCRILYQNVRVASAARLPVDPLGVGVNEEGTISPEDMFNPILYKAVSNQSLSNLEYRIRGLRHSTPTMEAVQGESADVSNENVALMNDEFDIYYSILSNTRGWKVAHPQSGLRMNKLRPLVFEKWYNEGVNMFDPNIVDTMGGLGVITSEEIPEDDTQLSDDESPVPEPNLSKFFTESMRGRPHPMPAFNTKYITGLSYAGAVAQGTYVANGMNTGVPFNMQAEMPDIPTIYTGIILVPPSKTTKLYYRMVVETVVSFFGVQTMDEITSFANLALRERFPVYWNDYRTAAKDSDLKVEEETISASEGSTIKKIMEA